MLSIYLGHCPSENDIKLLKDGTKVALLRLFSTIFLDVEKPISDEKQRLICQAEIEQIIKESAFPLDHYLDLHSQGLLKTKDLALSSSLSALHSFLHLD